MANRRLPWRRGVLSTLTTVFCLIVIGLVAISPLALTKIENLRKDWGELSSIGQTYGAISALISSLALGGVVVSLLYQARAGRTAREQSIRTLQQQLIRMEMDNPTLMTAMGAPWGLPIPADSVRIREHLYIHMWTSFWAGNFVVGEMTAPTVKKMARSELFNSSAGRRYWANVRDNVLNTNEGKYRQFALIVDDEYKEMIANNIPVAEPVRITDPTNGSFTLPKGLFKQAMLLGVAAATGALAARKLSQRTRRA
jgi:Family of unknown function (DUF6082)